MPSGVDVAVAWTWRLLVLGAGLLALGLVLGRVVLLTASFLGALLLTGLLQPAVARLVRSGAPHRLAAAGVFTAFVVLAGLAVTALGAVVTAQLDGFTGSLATGSERLVGVLAERLPVDRPALERLQQQAADALSSTTLLTGLLTAVGTLLDLVSGLGLALFIALVLLLDGRTVWDWVLRLLPHGARQPTDEAGQQAWGAVTAYLRGITVVALTDASLVALALLLLDVPAVAPLAALTFLGAFLPYVGAATAGLAAVAVALVDQGLTTGLLVLGAVLLVQTVDGYVLEPLVLGKAVRLHPLAVVVAITVGGTLAGVGGAVVAVPLTGAVNEAVVHLARRGRAHPPA